jgi:hypothetical protein
MNEKEALKVLAGKEKADPLTLKEAARVVLEARRQRDPLVQFQPGPTQEAFLASRTRYKLLSSANRGGKTTSIAIKIARCALRKDPVWSVPKDVNGLYCIFAPRRDQIVDPWFKKLCEGSELRGPCENEPMIPKREIKKVYYTHGGGKPMPKVIELNNGHRIWFGVSGDKHAWEGLEGKGMVLGIALDESAGTQNLIDECMVRLLDAHSHPAIKASCGGGWLDWGATETKLNDAFTNFRAKCEDETFNDYAAFWIKPDENPAIDPEERAKYAQVLSEDAFRARMEGEGGAHEALLVYPQYDDAHHWCDEPYEVTDEDTIYVGYDPGSNVSGLVFVAYNERQPRVGHVFAAKELRRTTLAAEAECIRRTTLGRRIEWMAYDQAARKVEKSSGSTVLWQMMDEMKKRQMTPRSGYFKGRSNYKDSVPVVRLALNDRRIILHKGSECLRAQFKSHRFTERSGELKEDNIQKGNDHVIDSFRYLYSTAPYWKKRERNPARVKDDGLEISYSQDKSTLTDEDWNIAEQMKRSRLYAAGKLPGW